MITSDNPLTPATIAREAGVDDFLAQANPSTNLREFAAANKPGQARRNDR
jgi:potassium-transporting ATPase ATP-binding subunit